MEVEAANMRADINRDQTNQTNSTVAFVRFATRRDAVICLKLFSEDDNEEIVASMPKGSVEDPHDIIWADLCVDEVKQGTLRRTGVLLLIAVFMTFAPAVLFIVSISSRSLPAWPASCPSSTT
ncbi:unnamed protein product [Prorocentrum cordatum]|uniref:RRM domain-containing protein n=1 Tax=Prorocentrum cordatum TaxID=2364126 RepID=A0ABN9VKL8_9DINO|nr:unnamed protein product [Polarella glacialis]